MATGGEECELQQLVPPDDDSRVLSKSGEVTPPVTAGVTKVTRTSPTSPDSNKVYVINILYFYIKCHYTIYLYYNISQKYLVNMEMRENKLDNMLNS